MYKIAKAVIAPIMSLIILVMGNGLFTTFTSLRLKQEGYSPEMVGYVTAAYFLGLVIGSIRSHKLIERIGYIRAFAIFSSCTAAFVMLQSLFIDPWIWMGLRFLSGICLAGHFITIESWLLVKSTTKTKGKVLSIYMIALYASQATGQFFLNIAPIETVIPFAITVIFASLSIVPVCFSRTPAPTIQKPSYLTVFKLYKISPLGVIGSILGGFLLGVIYGLLPIFAGYLDLDTHDAALIVALTIYGGLLLQWPIGYLSDLIDRRKVLFGVSIIIIILSLFIAWINSYSYPLLLVSVCLFGGFTFTVCPLSTSHTSDHLESSDDTIAALGGLILVYGIGAIIGPIIASYCMQILGAPGIFYYFAATSAVLGLYTLWRIFKQTPIPQEEKLTFRTSPRTTPLSSELDPRADEVKKNDTMD